MKTIYALATPLTIGAFLLMASTGVLMFFHLDSGLNKGAHEWLSWVFLTGVAMHVFRNLPSFKRHLGTRLGVVFIAVFAAILAVTYVMPVEKKGPPTNIVMETLAGASLENLAIVTDTTPQNIIDMLETQGITVTDTAQTLNDVSGNDPKRKMQLLGVIFSPK